MKIIIIMFLAVCSFVAVAGQQQSPGSGNVKPYRNSAEDYIRNLFSSTCELALKGGVSTNVPIDQSTKGLVAQATQGMEKGTSAYNTIYDVVILSATMGLSIKEKGGVTTQDKTKLYTCSDGLSYIDKVGFISKIVADLSVQEPSATKKADHQASDDGVYRTTAKALMNMYDENEVAADNKIGDRKVEVKGIVQSIDKDFTGSVVVLLQSGNEFMPARFGMEDTEKAKASRLVKGQQIIIICEKMMLLVGSPSGSRCRFN